MLDGDAHDDAVFPAYAGMIPYARRYSLLTTCVPRICGDDPQFRAGRIRCQECSPHMRG